jgi:hypothetical protein
MHDRIDTFEDGLYGIEVGYVRYGRGHPIDSDSIQSAQFVFIPQVASYDAADLSGHAGYQNLLPVSHCFLLSPKIAGRVT